MFSSPWWCGQHPQLQSVQSEASQGSHTHIHHDDVIKRKHFPGCWPFVRGIHRSSVGFPSQRPVTRSFDVFFIVRLNKGLNKQPRCWWFETPCCPLWRHCKVCTYIIYIFVSLSLSLSLSLYIYIYIYIYCSTAAYVRSYGARSGWGIILRSASFHGISYHAISSTCERLCWFQSNYLRFIWISSSLIWGRSKVTRLQRGLQQEND